MAYRDNLFGADLISQKIINGFVTAE